MSEKRITVDYLARCEGETGLDIVVGADGQVKEAKVVVFEPPRFFEGFLVGRRYDEVNEIVARICGICPTPHELSAVQAIERAMGVEVSEQTKDLRELLALSQWIQSHTLSIYMLTAPDYAGYESVIPMAGVPELLPVVQRALKLKRLGNDLTVAIGGREVHPLTVIVGGFTKIPEKAVLESIKERMIAAKEDAYETVKLTKALFDGALKRGAPNFVRECEHVAIHDPDHYAINDGRLVSTMGLNVPNWEYPKVIIEKHVPHSNAKHAIIEGRDSFLVGPLARVNLNFDQLSADAKAAAKEIGFQPVNYNPYASIMARAIEIVHSLDESIAIINRLQYKHEVPSYEVKAGESYAVTEAARGICCHGYKIDKYGIVEKADIVAPTARNVYNMEKDYFELVPMLLNEPDDEITLKCEMLIRSYDPCYSCSTHAIKVNLQRLTE